MGNLCSSQRI